MTLDIEELQLQPLHLICVPFTPVNYLGFNCVETDAVADYG